MEYTVIALATLNSVSLLNAVKIGADNTRVHYLSEKEAKRKKAVVFDSAESLMNDLGIPIISREQFDDMNK